MKTKTVIKFRGKEYDAPSWAKWMAIDYDGDVWIFQQKPHLGASGAVWVPSGESHNYERLCFAKPPKHPKPELYKLEE